MDRKALLREALAADKQTIPQYLDYESPSVNVTEWLRYSCIPVYEQENAAKDPELASSMEKALSLTDSALSFRVGFLVVPLSWDEDGFPVFPFEQRSEKLKKNLLGCDKAVLFAATIGSGIDRLIRRFEKADPKTDVRITFFGGEPLLNKPVIARVVERCKALAAERSLKAGFSLTTNGTLIDDETAEMLGGDFGLMVSLDGPKELHDRQCPTRDGEGSFDRATEGIRRLMKKRGVTVRCTMAHPAPDAMKLIRFFADFGFSRIVLGTVRNPAFPSACDFTEEDCRTFDRSMEDEILPWMLTEKAAGREPIYNPFDEIADFQGEKDHPEKVRGLRCGACHGSMAVAPDGTLYPCHRFVGMEAWAIGSLENGPDRERCAQFWRRHRECMKEKCGSCWAYKVCGGPCPWEIARSDGTFAFSEFLCKETCNWIRHGVYYLSKSKNVDSESGEKKQ